jgi:hypothetical protein
MFKSVLMTRIGGFIDGLPLGDVPSNRITRPNISPRVEPQKKRNIILTHASAH